LDQKGIRPDEVCLLVYDEGCRLCVGTKHALEQAGVGSAGSAIRFVPYQSEEAHQALGSRYMAGRPDAAFLITPRGDVREGLEAFLPLLPSLRGGRLLLWFFQFRLIKRAAELAYRVIARQRYRLFGKARSSHTAP
jgi:predicted DCC family thiol-disulfide oxidoreductase YuxK